MRTAVKEPISNGHRRSIVAVAAVTLAAVTIGVVIAGAFGSTGGTAIAGGVVALLVVAAAASLVAAVPVMAIARFSFIASFFFKADLNLFKIDEMEDPSGLNISLTLVIGAVLVFHDLVEEPVRDRLFPKAFTYIAGALFVCAAVSAAFGSVGMLGWFSVFSFLSSIFVAFVIVSHFSRRDRMFQLIAATAAGIIFTGAVALSQYVFDFPTDLAALGTGTEEELLGTQSQILSRVPAFLRTPTELAWIIASLVPLVVAPVICRVRDLSRPHKTLLLTAAFSGTVAVILSLARGSWIALAVALAVVVLFGWQRLSAKERSSYFITTGAAAVVACLMLAPFSVRIYDRLMDDDRGSALIRLPLMETAVRMIDDNALVGVGMNAYRANMTRYDDTGIFVSQVFPNPVHNVFAHITAEIGVPGGILFCLLILAVLVECFRSFSSGDRLLCAVALGAGAGIIAWVISAMKEPGSLGSARPALRTLFFVFGTVLAVGRMRRRLLL